MFVEAHHGNRRDFSDLRKKEILMLIRLEEVTNHLPRVWTPPVHSQTNKHLTVETTVSLPGSGGTTKDLLKSRGTAE